MSTLSLRLPSSQHRALRELARREGVSINQLITSAVGEKMAALMTESYLADRASRGDRSVFERVLQKVPDVEPEESNRLPGSSGRAQKASPASTRKRR